MSTQLRCKLKINFKSMNVYLIFFLNKMLIENSDVSIFHNKFLKCAKYKQWHALQKVSSLCTYIYIQNRNNFHLENILFST